MKKLPKKLYHVTLDMEHNGVFSPRIPASRMKTEDATTKRICVADSIEGCLTASPFGAHYLSESLLETDDCIKVFVIDTEKLGLTSAEVISPDDLYQSGKVEDAYLTGEHWLLKDITIPEEDHSILKITGMHDEDWKLLIPYDIKVQLEADKVNFDDYEEVDEAYYRLVGEEVPNLCMIQDVTYVSI